MRKRMLIPFRIPTTQPKAKDRAQSTMMLKVSISSVFCRVRPTVLR